MLDLEALDAELNAERIELLARAKTPIPLAKGDEVDLANIAIDKERVLWLTKDARDRVAAIEKALARIRQGVYGKCTACGGEIPEERLATIPLTLYCINCQTKLERAYKRMTIRNE